MAPSDTLGKGLSNAGEGEGALLEEQAEEQGHSQMQGEQLTLQVQHVGVLVLHQHSAMISEGDFMDRWKALSASCCPQLPCESVQRQPDNPSVLGSWATYSGNTELVGGKKIIGRERMKVLTC